MKAKDLLNKLKVLEKNNPEALERVVWVGDRYGEEFNRVFTQGFILTEVDFEYSDVGGSEEEVFFDSGNMVEVLVL